MSSREERHQFVAARYPALVRSARMLLDRPDDAGDLVAGQFACVQAGMPRAAASAVESTAGAYPAGVSARSASVWRTVWAASQLLVPLPSTPGRCRSGLR